MLAIDFETALIEPGLQVPPPVCMSAARFQGEGIVAPAGTGVIVPCPLGEGAVYSVEPALDLLQQHLEGDGKIAGLNTPFDLAVACEARPALLPFVFDAYENDRITDVATRQKLIDIAEGYDAHGKYGMQDLAWRLLDRYVAKEDTWRLRYWELSHLPLDHWPQEALEYSANDAVITLAMYNVQERELEAIDRLCVLADQYRQCRADFVLRLMSAWGLRSSREGCARLRAMAESTIDRLQSELLQAGLLKHKYRGRGKEKHIVGISRNIKATKESMLRDAEQRAESGQDPWKLLKLSPKGIETQYNGGPWRDPKFISTDKEACADADDPTLEKYTEYAKMDNLLSGFVKAIEQGIDAPIHTRYEVLLKSGRTSSSNPNVQNVRTIEGSRECFVPRSGWVYIACDVDRAELHTLAQCCINLFGRSTLADTLNAGIDPHTKFGARLARCSYEELEVRIKAEDLAAEGLRKRAKPANFGLPGGMGPNGLRRYAKGMYRVILTLDEARALHASWCEEYPDIAGDYLDWVKRLVGDRDYATIEHFDSKRWRGQVTFCAAANSFFQGMAADALKAALWELARKCYLPGTALYGCRLVNEIHDEVIIEAPLAQASDAAHETQSTLVTAYNTYTRDVPVHAKPVVMDCWSKKAHAILEDGVYKVWHYERKSTCEKLFL
jgi:DNA polymerase I-like protein with 3'-5' exonuclease and polymerase domains